MIQPLYNSLFEQYPDILILQDIHEVVVEVNKAFCDEFGILKMEIVGRKGRSFLPEANLKEFETYFNEALTGKRVSFETELPTANKLAISFEVIIFSIPSTDSGTFIQTILRDITPKTQFLKTIQTQAERVNKILESSSICFFSLDNQGKFTYVNEAAARVMQCTPHSLLGKPIWTVFPAVENSVFFQKYQEVFSTGITVQFETRGVPIPIWIDVKMVPAEGGMYVYFNDITEKVNARQELEQLSLVARNTTNGVIITDKDRRIKWVNEGFTRITGFSLEEALGTKPPELMFNPKADKVAHAQEIEKINEGEEIYFELLNAKKNGDDLWVAVQLNPIFDTNGKLNGHVAILTDINEKRSYLQQLEKLSLVAGKTHSSLLIADKDWRIEWVNEGFKRLLGYSPEEAIGRKPSEFLYTQNTDKSVYNRLEPKLMMGEPVSFEVLISKKNKEEIWVNIEISPVLNDQKQIIRFIEVQTDISALKKSELELAKVANDLYLQNSDLQQFTYIVSHNLRAPVANALGLAKLLKQIEKDSPFFEQGLTNLEESINQLDNVLKDMNTILSLRSKDGTIEMEHIDLNKIINEVIASLQESLSGVNSTFINELADGQTIYGNKAYVYSIFQNLFSNAINYRSYNRDLIIKLKGFGYSEKGLLLTFSDNGSGFDIAKAKNNLFKLYKRFHSDRKGSGMGLYLVKSHLDTLGGHIQVTSQVDKGTKFLIYLPKK